MKLASPGFCPSKFVTSGLTCHAGRQWLTAPAPKPPLPTHTHPTRTAVVKCCMPMDMLTAPCAYTTHKQNLVAAMTAPQLCTAGQPHTPLNTSAQCTLLHTRNMRSVAAYTTQQAAHRGTPCAPFFSATGTRRQSRRAHELCSKQAGRQAGTDRPLTQGARKVNTCKVLVWYRRQASSRFPSQESQSAAGDKLAMTEPSRVPVQLPPTATMQHPGPSCCQHTCMPGCSPEHQLTM
jgi:hypothetical protein